MAVIESCIIQGRGRPGYAPNNGRDVFRVPNGWGKLLDGSVHLVWNAGSQNTSRPLLQYCRKGAELCNSNELQLL